MKFGKQLQHLQSTLDTQSIPTLHYKGLKKLLKAEGPPQAGTGSPSELGDLPHSAAHPTSAQQDSLSVPLTEEDQRFLATLTQDITAFNTYYIEQEENFIIRLQSLEEAAEAVETASKEQQTLIQNALADLHGEMVLLVHWSLLNLAAVTKILKKHDKRGDGAALKAPILASILRQPFYSTEHVTDMITSADACMRKLQGSPRPSPAEDGRPSAADTPQLFKRTQAALDMWQQLGDGASTPSTILPVSKRLRADPTPGPVKASTPAAAAPLAQQPANVAGQAADAERESRPEAAAQPAAHAAAESRPQHAAQARPPSISAAAQEGQAGSSGLEPAVTALGSSEAAAHLLVHVQPQVGADGLSDSPAASKQAPTQTPHA